MHEHPAGWFLAGDTPTARSDERSPRRVAALAIAGGASVPFMRETATTLADALEGQTHHIDAAALAPPIEPSSQP